MDVKVAYIIGHDMAKIAGYALALCAKQLRPLLLLLQKHIHFFAGCLCIEFSLQFYDVKMQRRELSCFQFQFLIQS